MMLIRSVVGSGDRKSSGSGDRKCQAVVNENVSGSGDRRVRNSGEGKSNKQWG